jgi:hypothetical protein
MTDRERAEMSRKPGSNTKTKTKAARERHSKNVQASDARKREMGLGRIAVWVPQSQSDSFKRAAKIAVERHLGTATAETPPLDIPKPWRNPKPQHDRRQARLPF